MRHEFITSETQAQNEEIFRALVRAYATVFWAGTWKELLAVRSSSGEVLKQYGTYASDGSIYPETQELMQEFSVSGEDTNWPRVLWERAGKGELKTQTGEMLSQYWSLSAARKELERFIAPLAEGGYGGELLVLQQDGEVLGFTAYTCQSQQEALSVIDRRFPAQNLVIPAMNGVLVQQRVSQLIRTNAGDAQRIGVFLDHAVAELHRGRGLGSLLFDLRLQRLCETGAEAIVGRTMTTSPAQYRGNYLARGLKPIAAHGTTTFEQKKHYFLAVVTELTSR